MGTKRKLAPVVARLVRDNFPPSAHVVDLFAGLGTVASALASSHSVTLNDTQAFLEAFARARFIDTRAQVTPEQVLDSLYPKFDRARRRLSRLFEDRIEEEEGSVDSGRKRLMKLLQEASHVGNSQLLQAEAHAASQAFGLPRYCLATIYFSTGYFSTRQAIELDALRYAIDALNKHSNWLLAAWLSAAGAVLNSPGHTAQYLKPSKPSSYTRLKRQWKRSIWKEFSAKLSLISPLGRRCWRSQNRYYQGTARAFLSSANSDDFELVYADPPYTKAQYSRFYHVYETLYLYDFPEVTGQGRYRDRRFRSGFSLSSQVEAEFNSLCLGIAEKGSSLLLSYPSNGLLCKKVPDVSRLLEQYFQVQQTLSFQCKHSTLGASSGKRTIRAVEQLILCRPR